LLPEQLIPPANQQAFIFTMNKIDTGTGFKRKVDLLKSLQAKMERDGQGNLLLVQASGISNSENAGIPKLIPGKGLQLTNGILEFNFIVQGSETGSRKKLEWDVAVVFQMEKLPEGIKAIKVNAAQNADIVILTN
jgi:hypothetical protein